MFEVGEKVRCVANTWDADDIVEQYFNLDHTPKLGGEYTVQGYVPPGAYPFRGGTLTVETPLLRLWEIASPLDIAGADGFPACWFRRAVKFDISEGMEALRSLTTNPHLPVPADT